MRRVGTMKQKSLPPDEALIKTASNKIAISPLPLNPLRNLKMNHPGNEAPKGKEIFHAVTFSLPFCRRRSAQFMVKGLSFSVNKA